MAQLGARLNRTQEVRGSIPLSSTLDYKGLARMGWPLFSWIAWVLYRGGLGGAGQLTK